MNVNNSLPNVRWSSFVDFNCVKIEAVLQKLMLSFVYKNF